MQDDLIGKKELLNKFEEMLSIQKDSVGYDNYMRGMYNGMEFMRTLVADDDPKYLEHIPAYHPLVAFFYVPKEKYYYSKKDSIIYIYSAGRRKRLIAKIFSGIQYALWKCGINVHNPINGDCTPNSNCCKVKSQINGQSKN